MRTIVFASLISTLGCTGFMADPLSGDHGGPCGTDGGTGVDPGDPPDGGGSAGGAGRIVGYFASWAVYGRDYHVAEIPADLVTHVNYAFANVNDAGECALGDSYADIDKFYDGDSWDAGALRGSFHQLQLVKAAHPDFHALISVGGWTWSGRFSDVAATAEGRSRFAASCVELFITRWPGVFDGIDVDWEFPGGGGLPGNASRPEDPANFVLLLAELRQKLDDQGGVDGRHYDLTIAAPSGAPLYQRLDLPGIAAQVDWINLMAYDIHGGWESATGYNAPLYPEIDAAVSAYLTAGVPADQLVLGVPFYGRGWSGVAGVDGGAAIGVPTGTWDDGTSGPTGVFDWADLQANYLPRLERHWDDAARVPYLYDDVAGVWISYDDPESIGDKADYLQAHGLGGAMIWELSGDDDDHALLGALQVLR